MALGLLLSDDLIFTSRVSATARAHGHAVKSSRTMTDLLKSLPECAPACVILDLHNTSLDLPTILSELRERCPHSPKVIAYGSHVDAARLKAARAAGCDLVLPRSQFVERLETELPQWLGSE